MPRRRRSPRASSEPREPPDASAAMEMAVRFLAPRPRTRWEVARRLARASVAPEVVEVTLERLAEVGYLDDVAFARWWTEQRDRHAPRGRRMLEAELRQRGVPRDVVEAYREEHDTLEPQPEDEALPGTERERAAEALARHLRGRAPPQDARALQRLGTFLMRRGFDAETVRWAIRAAGADTGDDEV